MKEMVNLNNSVFIHIIVTKFEGFVKKKVLQAEETRQLFVWGIIVVTAVVRE